MNHLPGQCIGSIATMICIVIGCVVPAWSQPGPALEGETSDASVPELMLEDVTGEIVDDAELPVRWAWKLGGEFASECTIVQFTTWGDDLILLTESEETLTVRRFDSGGQEMWGTDLPMTFTGSHAILEIVDERICVGATAMTPLVAMAGEVVNEVYLAELDMDGDLVSQSCMTPSFLLSPTLEEKVGVALEVTDVQRGYDDECYVGGVLWVPHGQKTYATPFLAKVNQDGETLWSQLIAPDSPHLFKSDTPDVHVIVYDETVLLVGSTRASLDGPNQGQEDLFVAGFETEGYRQWVHQFGSSESDVLVDAGPGIDGGVYLVGTTEGDFADQCAGRSDGFVLHCNAQGAWDWGVHSLLPGADGYVGVTTDPQEETPMVLTGIDGGVGVISYNDQGDVTSTRRATFDGLLAPERLSVGDGSTLVAQCRYFEAIEGDQYEPACTVLIGVDVSESESARADETD